MRRVPLILVAVILLFSCAQKRLVPVGNGVSVDPKSHTAVYEDERIRILVKANAWDGYPESLSYKLLPIYMEVVNKGDEPVELKKEDIVLIDDLGNQYNPLDPKDAAEVARGGSRVGVSVGVGLSTSHYGLGWLAGTPYDVDAEDVVNKAFIPGRVYPGAKLKGFLYFQKLHDKANRVTLRIGYKIGGRPSVTEFKFRVEDGKGSADNGNKEDREEDR